MKFIHRYRNVYSIPHFKNHLERMSRSKDIDILLKISKMVMELEHLTLQLDRIRQFTRGNYVSNVLGQTQIKERRSDTAGSEYFYRIRQKPCQIRSVFYERCRIPIKS